MKTKSTENGNPPLSRVTVLYWVVFAFLGAYAGPFGTSAYDPGSRLLFWAGVVVASSLLSRFCQQVAIRIVGKAGSYSTDAVTVVLMTIIFTPVLFLLTRTVLTSEIGLGRYMYFAQYVAIISACVMALRRFLMQTLRWHMTVGQPADEGDQPRLLRRLPDGAEGRIVRLTGRGHFVDVVTESETHRIRLRFADAVDEMDRVAGYYTHRSHWVAQHAIAGVERDSGRITVRLVNGDQVPVSRSYRPGLEEAGILDLVSPEASGSRTVARQ